MLCLFLVFLRSLPDGCYPGVTRHLWHPYSYDVLATDSDMFCSGSSFAGFGFHGSFCPQIDAKYRIIVEGTYDEYSESKYSYYIFNDTQTKSRTTPFLFLQAGACYKYAIWTSAGWNSCGKFYIQRENFSKEILNYERSFSCYMSFCWNSQGEFPNCKPFTEYHSSKFQLINILYMAYNLVLLTC